MDVEDLSAVLALDTDPQGVLRFGAVSQDLARAEALGTEVGEISSRPAQGSRDVAGRLPRDDLQIGQVLAGPQIEVNDRAIPEVGAESDLIGAVMDVEHVLGAAQLQAEGA